MGKFAASIECSKTKNASASGGFAPLAPDQGLCLWIPLGALPSDPRYRLSLPRSPWGRAPQILRARTAIVLRYPTFARKASSYLGEMLPVICCLSEFCLAAASPSSTSLQSIVKTFLKTSC